MPPPPVWEVREARLQSIYQRVNSNENTGVLVRLVLPGRTHCLFSEHRLCYNRPRVETQVQASCSCEGDVLSISFSARVVVPSHVLLQQVGGESVLLNLEKECYFGLDPVGTRMWEALTKANTVEAAYKELLLAYDVDEQRLRQDLENLIEALVANGLLEASDE
jgi:hypothetical protein